MKPWYRKKKCWAAILGALLPVLTIILLPERVEMVERICLAIIEAGVAAGFIFAEASIDKADRKTQKSQNCKDTEKLRYERDKLKATHDHDGLLDGQDGT